MGCGGDVLRVHEGHCMAKEEEVRGGHPGYDCVESGDLGGAGGGDEMWCGCSDDGGGEGGGTRDIPTRNAVVGGMGGV